MLNELELRSATGLDDLKSAAQQIMDEQKAVVVVAKGGFGVLRSLIATDKQYLYLPTARRVCSRSVRVTYSVRPLLIIGPRKDCRRLMPQTLPRVRLLPIAAPVDCQSLIVGA